MNKHIKITVLAVLSLVMISAVNSSIASDAAPSADFKFAFGSAETAKGFTAVAPTAVYSKEKGFGFEPGADLKVTDHGGVTSEKGFFFSVALPEGNYKVTVTLGGAAVDSETTVNAELRRLMLQQVEVKANKTVTRTFVVNVRQPAIAGGSAVRLGAREKTSEMWAWDDRLTLEFLGSHPSVAAIEIAPVKVPTIFLLGDSTVCDQPREPYNSWGQMITRFFKPTVAVANHSESGESIAGSLGKGRFDKIYGDMKPGDYLFVQFGHNDMKSTAPNALESYTTSLGKIVDEVRKRGGTPVLCTSVSRRSFDNDGKISNSFRGYTDAVRTVAKEKNCALIDLQQMGAAFYEALGVEPSHQAFATSRENTHHNDYGSYEIAKCVLQGIKQDKLPLAEFIVDDFKSFDPSHPDAVGTIKIPVGTRATSETPEGN